MHNVDPTRLCLPQVIELEAHAIKGVGREHAKWSPVATAWYRLRPEVVLLQRVAGADAQQLVEAFRNKDGTPGLFVLEGEELRVQDAPDYENRLEEVRVGCLAGVRVWVLVPGCGASTAISPVLLCEPSCSAVQVSCGDQNAACAIWHQASG
jgi:hypothetical protein